MKEPRIAHLAERADRAVLEAGIEAIFFETAAIRSSRVRPNARRSASAGSGATSRTTRGW